MKKETNAFWLNPRYDIWGEVSPIDKKASTTNQNSGNPTCDKDESEKLYKELERWLKSKTWGKELDNWNDSKIWEKEVSTSTKSGKMMEKNSRLDGLSYKVSALGVPHTDVTTNSSTSDSAKKVSEVNNSMQQKSPFPELSFDDLFSDSNKEEVNQPTDTNGVSDKVVFIPDVAYAYIQECPSDPDNQEVSGYVRLNLVLFAIPDSIKVEYISVDNVIKVGWRVPTLEFDDVQKNFKGCLDKLYNVKQHTMDLSQASAVYDNGILYIDIPFYRESIVSIPVNIYN